GRPASCDRCRCRATGRSCPAPRRSSWPARAQGPGRQAIESVRAIGACGRISAATPFFASAGLGPGGILPRQLCTPIEFRAMLILLSAFGASLFLTLVMVAVARRHARFFNDHDFSGPQKFHARVVPRVGGIGIVAGVLLGCALLYWRDDSL